MRIKLATSKPLPTFNCWFAISDKQEKQTIHQLRKKITKDLDLKSEPSNIQLIMDGFNLLPQTIIKDLVRDGDIITIKEEKNSVKPIEKKRKISSTIEEKHDKEDTPVTKKAKKSKDTKDKKSSTKDTTIEKISKTSNEIKEKAPKKSKDVKEKSVKKSKEKVVEEPKEKTKKSKRVEVDQQENITPPATKKQKSLPFEGLPKTKKRNMRRRILKQQLRNTTEANSTATIETSNKLPAAAAAVDPELQVQNLTISNAEPLQLIKKNKNKKKNHMKQMDQRSHVHYTPEAVVDEEQPVPAMEKTESVAATKPVSKNPFGRAFVTYVETERNYKGRNNTSKYPPHEYPIHRVPTLFYADQGLDQEEMAYQPEPVVENQQEAPIVEVEVSVEEEQEVQAEPEKQINYEQDFPEADFTKNIPSIGDKLAIKTLELTAAYTPEISDWKQVILKELDNGQVTIEYSPGFGKATTKGGKFDIRKKKKRYDDDWYEEEIEEEEEEEEVQVTMAIADIFAMRNMSS